MIKNMIKICLLTLGIGLLVYGIIDEIDGIGRFVIVLFGSIFSLAGGCISFEKKKLSGN